MIILHHFHTLIHLYKTLQYLFLSVWIPWLSSLHLGGLGVWILSKTEKKNGIRDDCIKVICLLVLRATFLHLVPQGIQLPQYRKKDFFRQINLFINLSIKWICKFMQTMLDIGGRNGAENDNSGFMKVHRQILTQITKQPTSVASQPAS